jgi:hypothetical protein
MAKVLQGGWSIEIVGYKLEYRGEHNDLALYESIGGRITAIAFVEKPAIEINAIVNDEQRTIGGPIMIPDLKILREEGIGGRRENCYWYFSKETIAELRKTFIGTIKFGH